MKSKLINRFLISLLGVYAILLTVSCEREEFDLEPAKYPATAEVFIDTFSGGLEYAAFGDSKVDAFDVDTDVVYKGTASMRFDIPNEGNPEGSYAGGVFRDLGGRDLTEYDALTFYAKASQGGSINLIGFGSYFGEDEYATSLTDLSISTAWTKYVIPIPDPSKLVQEKGMLIFAEGPENGKGYTIWLDEVKFEALGTLAQPRPAIQNGTDVTEQTYNGITTTISGLTHTVNLPNGVDQTVGAAPSYFEFTSSDPSVATVDELGVVTVLSEGTTTITAKLDGVDADGSLTLVSLGDFVAAPTPTQDPSNVISIFSDAYENVPVDFYNGYFAPYQTTQGQDDLDINGDKIIKYTQLNFVATEFKNPTVDATSMTYFHADIQIDEDIDPGDFIKIELGDFGADDVFGGGDDASGSVTITDSELTKGSWISLDLPLANFSGLTSTANLAQIFFVSDATISTLLVDNMYFYKEGGGGGGNEPTEAAPAPTQDEVNVISVYGDTYTNLEGTDYPDWGQATVVSDVEIGGNKTLKFAGLNYQGTQFASSLDLSGMEYLHIDYWTANSSALNVYLISTGPVETPYALTVPTSGWASVDIPLSSFSPVDLTDVIQMKYDGNGDIYLDNIFFYKTGGGSGSGPTSAAPTPVQDPADVVSIYSDAYTDIAFDNFDAGWCGGAAVTGVTIEGNNTLKKNAGVDCQGIDFSSNRQDLSAYTHIHFDFYTDDTDLVGDVFNVKLVDFAGGGGEVSNLQVNINTGTTPAIVANTWVSVDVDITSLGGVVAGSLTRSDVAQIGITTANLTNVWYDNIYLYKTSGGTCEDPTEAPPTPAQDAADVISVFSDAYTDIANTNFNPGWGQSTIVTTESIGGGNTLKYDVFNFQGTNLGGTDGVDQDLSSMEYLHIDMWTCDATVVGVTPISRTTGEKLVNLTPISTGEWNSYDIPLSDFAGVSFADIFQLKFDGQAGVSPSKIFIDNIYFYKSASGTCEEPTVAPPTPTEDAADVISVFSDAYTDIANTNFNPGWGQSTIVTTESIGGGNTLKYDVFNFQGTNLGGTDGVDQDLSSMEYLHIDMWTCDATVVGVTPISRTTGEKLVNLTPISTGQWNSYDIPLSDFAGVSFADIFQLKFDGQAGVSPSKIFIDNIYFYKTGGGSSGGPSEAAPTPPTRDAANVVSIYSDAYTNITFDNFDAGWCGGAATTEVSVAGNNTLKKNAGVDCHGIDFSTNKQDLSSFTHLHFDFYTDDVDLIGDVFNVKLVDFGGGSAEASALEVNINTGTSPGIVSGAWVSVDVDITALGGVVANNLTRSDVAQIGITTANLTNVWYDNIYLYK